MSISQAEYCNLKMSHNALIFLGKKTLQLHKFNKLWATRNEQLIGDRRIHSANHSQYIETVASYKIVIYYFAIV